MQNFRDYYEILGIAPQADLEQIKRSYRQLARRYHPDLNPNDKIAEERFKDLTEAYEILSDSDRRSQYDQYRRYWLDGKGRRNGRRPASRNGGTDYSQYQDFNSFVDQLRSRRAAATAAAGPRVRTATTASDNFRPGTTRTARVVSPKTPRRDIEARLTLPLEKAYRGGRERIRLEDGRSLEVDMPPGMQNRQRVRLKGQGLSGGDLYLRISLSPHPFFSLDGTDLFCQVPLTPVECVLGGSIEVPTIDGPVKMTVPQGVSSGQRLRLANKGFPNEAGERGDQLVEIQVISPTDISNEAQELYQKLRELETFNPRESLL
ncbi:MAG: J domain-containing protein [Cyanobacteria bacterium P01_H01_bin.15]